MKRILPIGILIIALSFLFVFVGCTSKSRPPEATTAPTTTPESTVYYDITFMVDGEATVVRTAENEIPVFSGSTDLETTVSTIYTFTGWDRELLPATENTMYVARYQKTARLYPVHFSINGTVVKTVQIPYGSRAEYPDGSTYNGINIAFWTNAERIQGETTCEAVCTSYDVDTLLWAYDVEPTRYKNTYESDGNVNVTSSAMLYLIMAEHDDRAGGLVRDRALDHLRSIITGGQEPGFNAGPFWSYASVSMSIALARHTPTIWDELTTDEKDRLTLLMECYAILACFVSDDDNNYKTGPALTGNFHKAWNPNHRMAMILPIVASTAFFSADGQNGAARVNEILTGFDHDAYIARFTEYGFTRIIYNWTTEGMTLADGTVAPGARELMMNGGDAYICHEDGGTTANGLVLGSYVNSGVGVRTTYTYGGAGLDEITRIVNSLYSHNYSGGTVISDTSSFSGGVNPTTGQPYAFIADGTKSPYDGKNGMMLELVSSDAGGIRSSNSYCTHDFVLVVESLAALSAIGVYEIDTDSDLFYRMWVGNGDLIYKNEHGYNSYSIGQDRGVYSDASFPEYLPWKAWWKANYANTLKLTKDLVYQLSGGSCSPEHTYYEVSDEDVVVSLPTPTHPAGTFIGWFLDSGFTSTETENLKISGNALTIKAEYCESVQLYAKYEIADNVNKGKVIVCFPGGLGLDGVYDSVYYDLGTDVVITLPSPRLPEGYRVVSWHLKSDFSDAPLGDDLTISAEDAAKCHDVKVYAKVEAVYYEQLENALLTTAFSDKAAQDGNGFTLRQVLSADGSVLLTKHEGEDGYFRVEGLSIKTGYLTIEATIYADDSLAFVASGFRLRNSNVNTPDSVGFSANGAIKIGGVEVGAVSTTPTRYSFVFYEQEDGVGYIIDFYVNGVYQASATHDIVVNGSTTEVDVSSVSVLHWYFGKNNVGAMHISDLRVVDGCSVTHN